MKKINAGKDYFDYSLISTENIKTTKADIKSVDYFKNDSIWGTNNPAINNGYPYIKEMYW